MVENDIIEITVQYPTLKYWKDKGYDCYVGSVIYVSLNEVPSKSNIMIGCICDLCGRKYFQRRSRDLDVCGHCKTSNRLKGNTNGSKNAKYKTPPKDELMRIIDSGGGKSHIAKKYDVTIPVVDRWLKETQIELIPYQGRKFFKSDEERSRHIEAVRTNAESFTSISELSKKIGIPRHIVRLLAKEDDISLPSQFKNWQKELNDIKDNIDHYTDLNKTQTLKAIADDKNISIEQLKRAFQDTNSIVRSHSYNKSVGELEVRDYVRSLGLDCYSFKIYKTYEVDCFVPKHNFGIEYCGEYWHRYVPEKQNKYYHRDKQRYMESKNIQIMTLFESEWKANKELVKSMIKSKLGFTSRLHARKCSVNVIDKSDADAFHKSNHINRSTTSSINIGLSYDGELVSVLSLMKSRFDRQHQYEISRYSTIKEHTVVGGFSKMFSHFTKTFNPDSCMTYADLRFGTGNVYAQSGFSYIDTTAPNYFYFNIKLGYLENRMKYQKGNLKSLPGYDVNKTEFEIMHDSGYFKLYDCGNKKYGWRKN